MIDIKLPNIGDGIVDVVEEDLSDTCASLGEPFTEVDEPAVVCLNPGVAEFVFLGARRRREEHEGWKERWHGVGENHFADHPVGVLLAVAHLVVPVAEPTVVAQIAERILVAPPPRVELVVVLGFEVLAILRVAASGVGVG